MFLEEGLLLELIYNTAVKLKVHCISKLQAQRPISFKHFHIHSLQFSLVDAVSNFLRLDSNGESMWKLIIDTI